MDVVGVPVGVDGIAVTVASRATVDEISSRVGSGVTGILLLMLSSIAEADSIVASLLGLSIDAY